MFCAMHGLVTIFAPTEPFLMYDSVALGGDGGIEVDSISNFTHSLKHYFGVLIGQFYTGLNILHKQRL